MPHPHHKLGNWASARLEESRVPKDQREGPRGSSLRRGHGNLMPDFKAQMVNSVPPEIELDERVWNYYYKKYRHMTVTPEFFMFLKRHMLEQEAKEKK